MRFYFSSNFVFFYKWDSFCITVSHVHGQRIEKWEYHLFNFVLIITFIPSQIYGEKMEKGQ